MRFLAICAVFIVSVAGLAQVSVKGRVRSDSMNLYLQNVAVSLPELNLVTLSDSSGLFTFKNLPKGSFTILFKEPQFRSAILLIKLTDSLDMGTVVLKPGYTQINEVVVYGSNNSDFTKTANTIQQLTASEMRSSGAMNLSDGIAKLPGVSQLSTGSGISKPVIRGLFGNRIQTVLYGLRFDNQQWQDEHGLGLSDVGIDRVEIIKGPAALLYGSEAMGGVINIIEEKSAPVNKINSDFSTRFFSNTYGVATDAGVKGATGKFNWRLRAGMDSHADYSDGNNKRVLNSRFGGYYAKAGVGFNRKRWINQTNYMFTQNNFGFLMDPVQLLDPPDDRMSRDFSRPHHTVNLNILSTQNTFFMNASKLKVNAGIQNNERQEQEGGNKISLDMILNSYLANATWIKGFANHEWSIGSQGYFQTNKNVGSRTIIPDAELSESSLFSYIRLNFKKLMYEGGLRFDYRNIQTFATGAINTDPASPGYMIKPFNRNYNSLNGSSGISWFGKNLNFKTNFSTGYRAANLAELSSNGLHEGTARYEIGNTNLKIEQNICGDVYAGYSSDYVNVSASAYYNQFLGYIYLAPSSDQYIGFQIFNYKQQDASIQGVEGTLDLHTPDKTRINWISSYSYILGKLNNGNNLPFIPAPRINSDFKFTHGMKGKIKEVFFKPGIAYVFQQDRPGDFETQTDAYFLVNASLSAAISTKKNNITVSLAGNNLLNNAYYDHLSRFKYYGIYNTGRNISLNFKIQFI
ncbi:MAG: TonB-dependent receptor [Bacteroidetes bacterium]|nr:TonB-dependent receptor [Bacteroidota bacterium]